MDVFFYITGPERLVLLVGADQSVDVAFGTVLVPTNWKWYGHTWEILKQDSKDKKLKRKLHMN